MGGEINLDQKQQHAMQFASQLRSAGFIDAATYLENIYVKPAFGIDEPKTFTYHVGPLTKDWAFKGTESVIRALSGDAIKPHDKVIIKRKKKRAKSY